MALIKTIPEIKQYVRVNFSSANSSLPDVEAAELQFLVPVLGDELYQAITAENPDAKYNALIALCKKVVAPLAYWMDLPTIQTQISDSGVHTTLSDKTEAAHQWEFDNLREALASKGCLAIEQLLKYLFNADNAEVVGWEMIGEYNTLIKTAEEFSRYFTLRDQPYRVFETLRPVITEVEDKYLRPSLSDDFFEELRDTVDPGTEAKKAIELLKKAAAQYTIYQAAEKLPVKFGINGFTVIMRDASNKSYQGEQAATDAQMATLAKNCERSGDGYMLKLKEYLNANASPTLFNTWYTGDLYEAPVDPATIPNPNDCSTIFRF